MHVKEMEISLNNMYFYHGGMNAGISYSIVFFDDPLNPFYSQ